MLKEFLWNTFINTGELEAYTFYKEIRDKGTDKNKSVKKYEEEIASIGASISSEHK
jgi:hypothetical protein